MRTLLHAPLEELQALLVVPSLALSCASGALATSFEVASKGVQ
eukprot:CAMPEP_0197458204 /NCGR_PEP_ID=MMETSP1175-20131217/48036_1 /TAXON_ID=1003142 /ORGANISM="Triceratium dubium, Strain CCMP147" /LENGTH=42 /DNA_ID= /DNA_START= /DNA_END= /DNA_ORIENTATION=